MRGLLWQHAHIMLCMLPSLATLQLKSIELCKGKLYLVQLARQCIALTVSLTLDRMKTGQQR